MAENSIRPTMGTVDPDTLAQNGLKQNGEERENDVDEPKALPPDPLLVAQLEDWAWLDQLRGEGKLDQYRGEYVFAAERQIFGHGRNLVRMRPRVEKKAHALGIQPERIINYFIPGE